MVGFGIVNSSTLEQNRNTVTEWAKGYPELEVVTGHATFLAWIESYNQTDLSERFVRQGVRLSLGQLLVRTRLPA